MNFVREDRSQLTGMHAVNPGRGPTHDDASVHPLMRAVVGPAVAKRAVDWLAGTEPNSIAATTRASWLAWVYHRTGSAGYDIVGIGVLVGWMADVNGLTCHDARQLKSKGAASIYSSCVRRPVITACTQN